MYPFIPITASTYILKIIKDTLLSTIKNIYSQY